LIGACAVIVKETLGEWICEAEIETSQYDWILWTQEYTCLWQSLRQIY